MIGRDTKWYLEQAKKLDSVTRDLRVGNPLKHQERLAKIDKASIIIDTAFAVVHAFRKTKESQETYESSIALIALGREAVINQYNLIHKL